MGPVFFSGIGGARYRVYTGGIGKENAVMSYLNDFQDVHRALIVSLPVRIGFWMSQADDAPGDRDDARERLALQLALKKIVAKTGDDAFTNDVAEFALSSPKEWMGWEQAAVNVLDDVPAVLKLVKDTLPPDAVTAYRKMLYFIANVVAQAASEAGDAGNVSTLSAMTDRLSVKTDLSVPGNVSDREIAALQQLLAVLKA